MKIVSVVTEAFQEWHEEVSLALACYSCNFDCPWCSMRTLAFDETKVIGDAEEIIARCLNPMHTAVVLSGGEPLVWGQDVFDLAQCVKSMGLKFKIFTNGYLYQTLIDLNNLNLVDAYSIDFKGINKISQAIGSFEKSKNYLECFLYSCHNVIVKKIPLEIRVTQHEFLDLEKSLEFLKDTIPEIPVIIQKLRKY